MAPRILYPVGTGIAIIIPALPLVSTVHELARKDVPTGVKYKIVDSSIFPADRTLRDALEWDFTDYDGVGE